MDKMKMHTKNIADENYAALAKLFPNALTEKVVGYDEEGKAIIERAIDVDVLRQEISCNVVEGREERYQFTWPDKKKAMLLVNESISSTLRPCREESVAFDNTENLYIEGDNLDVLKLLQETYLGKVKLIYIDPPYNTGNDAFVYDDSFYMTTEEFASVSGLHDSDGNLVFNLKKNNESNGRFHTDWLNMMYSRLKLAKNLLSSDGLIFINIDDNEVENMLKLGNEIFGEDNFINLITVKTKVGGVSGSSEGKSLKDATEFIGVFVKDKSQILLNPVYIKTKLSDRIESYRVEGKSWKYTSVIAELDEKELIFEDKMRGWKYYGYRKLRTESIATYAKEKGISEEEVYDRYADRIFQTTNAQSSVRHTLMKEMEGYDYPMIGLEYVPGKGKNEGKTIEILYKGEQRRMMMFLSDAVDKIDGTYYYLDKITTLWDDIEYNNLSKEGNIEFPNGKKPIKLLQRIIDMATDEDSIILDFFSGSASTAHAVLQCNAEQKSHRKFILVQLPEKIDENSEHYQQGFRTICDLGKERIRRSIGQISDGNSLDITQGAGFRVLKLDSSNMKDVYYNPAQVQQQSLFASTDNIKEDRTPEDLLFQVMLDLGVLLSSKIEEKVIAGKKVFNVADGFLIACFDNDVTEDTVKAVAQEKPYYAVFRDSSMANDSVATNFEQIFATYSPETVRKVL